MKSQLTRQQIFAVGLAVFGLVLGLGAYLVLVAPQKSKAVALAGAVEAAQSSLFVLQHNPQIHRKPKPPDVQAADLFRLTKAMPDSVDVPGILLSLMRLAKASSINLVSVQPPTTTTPTSFGFSTASVQLTVNGKFTDVANFLQRLRDSVVVVRNHLKVTNRLFVPNTISLTENSDGTTVDGTIAVNAFVYGTVAPPAAPTSTTGTSTTPATTTTATTTTG